MNNLPSPDCGGVAAGRHASLLTMCAVAFAGFAASSLAADLPEPGPENAGMRLRFIVTRKSNATNDTFDARFDVISVTNKPVTLLADFESDKGDDFKEYLAGSVKFSVDPAVMPYMGQTTMPLPRKKPQPEYTLAPGETLTVHKTGVGRSHCPTDGLYSLRGSILLRVAGSDWEKQWGAAMEKKAFLRAQRTNSSSLWDDDPWERRNAPGNILLRSNEQQVPVGGSHALPKFPMGRLINADTNELTASFDLGSAQRIEVGDRFRIFTGGIGEFWILKITHADPHYSFGKLEWLSKHGRGPQFDSLKRGTSAALITPNDIWR